MTDRPLVSHQVHPGGVHRAVYDVSFPRRQYDVQYALPQIRDPQNARRLLPSIPGPTRFQTR